MALFQKLFGTRSEREIRKFSPQFKKILALEDEYRALSDEELAGKTQLFRERLAQGETLDDLLPEAFATAREAADRVLGLRPYPVQLIGGIVLHQGRIAEMKTGEGKTLVAILPAYLNALEGKGVHIVTVNDYLAKRDSEWMGKVYRFLGMSVGLVIHEKEPANRKEEYAADITYCTNNELGFDYLRDNMVLYKEGLVQRGHHFAIVDEVDSILIDEARTPLIISGVGEKSNQLYEQADTFVSTLRKQVFATIDGKEEKGDYDCDYVVDEKARTATLTARGIAKAEQFFGVENLSDPENTTLNHHINQALRAHGVMKRDIDYVIKDGQIIIVDEFTGRLMYGRRYSEGLHQAIEAKEHVEVASESKTLATITFQNFFRLYDKLSGMTGTALTEEAEFNSTYDLDVVEIPTNKPVVRIDNPDAIYKNEAGKFRAIIRQIKVCHEKGQPVLVGTISIEKSEMLSQLLKREGIAHNVLNAKHHEKEAEIIAQAGKLGAVTIATNMAGRGTDIMLGGNAEYLAKSDLRKQGLSDELIAESNSFAETDDPEILAAREAFNEAYRLHKQETDAEAEKVRAAGGLCILGTERHESRRIDNQLRGRSGRQGDPGETRFYLSFEDELVRLFGSDRMKGMVDTLTQKFDDDDALMEMKFISNAIENAQKMVEGRNFQARKSTLQYDDVMNVQRNVIYENRRRVLNGEDLSERVAAMRRGVVESEVRSVLGEHGTVTEPAQVDEILKRFNGVWFAPGTLKLPESVKTADEIEAAILKAADASYAAITAQRGEDAMREMERVITLRVVDEYWMEHIDAMTDLRQGVSLRSYGQVDPVVVFRREGSEMFDAMNAAIREEIVRRLFIYGRQKQNAPKRERVARITNYGASDGTVKRQPIVKKIKIKPNDPCPCGSGKKYKKCCRDKDQAAER